MDATLDDLEVDGIDRPKKRGISENSKIVLSLLAAFVISFILLAFAPDDTTFFAIVITFGILQIFMLAVYKWSESRKLSRLAFHSFLCCLEIVLISIVGYIVWMT